MVLEPILIVFGEGKEGVFEALMRFGVHVYEPGVTYILFFLRSAFWHMILPLVP